MNYYFRVRFTVPGKGSFTSDQESIPFQAPGISIELKLSSASAGVSMGDSDRLTVYGGPFEQPGHAQQLAEQVRVALLRRAVAMRRGLDLGQLSLQSFAISDYGKQYIAEKLAVEAVQEDRLGITVYTDNPRPRFVGVNMQGRVSMPAEKLIEELTGTIGKFKYRNDRAEISSGIYAFSHFVGRAPARFLVLFVCLEALFDSIPRSESAQTHVQHLIKLTQESQIEEDERQAIASSLTFLKNKSIHQTGREFAATLLPGNTYRNMASADFFSHLYKIRNNMVHKGDIDPKQIHELLGDMDQFVSDILLTQYVEP